MNIQARARLVGQKGAPLRDQLLSRPELLGRLNRRWAEFANTMLSNRLVRQVLGSTLGISKHAPLPRFRSATFRDRHPELCLDNPVGAPDKLVAYFHGCSVNHYEPELGDLTLEVLEKLGFRVVLPPQNCCGLPLQSNGLFGAARKHAHSNLVNLKPFVDAGVTVLGTSTSCTLELKHEYQAVLSLHGNGFKDLAGSVRDIFEFLLEHWEESFKGVELQEVPLRILYHPPCQLKSHWIGAPALELMQAIPGLEINISQSECCGVAGTYGIKKEKYAVARDVGARLFQQSASKGIDLVVTDSETCRWWIRHHTNQLCVHPIEILAIALGLREQVIEYPPSHD